MSSYLSKIRNLIPSWRDNVAQFEVYIYEGEYCQIKHWVLQKEKENIETGGDLFGLWIDSHKAVVQFVLGPGRKCKRSNVSFYQDISYLSDVGDYLLKNHGLCNIGQWHSHHRIKLDRPSVGDERTVWNNLPDLNLNSYIVFIATIKDGRDGRPAVDVNCFLFELDVNGSPLPVQKGQFKKINNDSPMRLHCEILDRSSYGAEPVKPAIDHSGNQQDNIESGSYDAHFSTSRKNDSEKNSCWIELLENKNELENTNEQPKVLKQDGEKEEGKEGSVKEDEKEGEKEGKEEEEKEDEKEGKEEERKEVEEGKEEEKKEEEEGKEEKKEKEEVEEGKEKGEQQEREVEREEEGEQQEEEEEEEEEKEEEDREEEKEEVKCKTGNMSKGGDTLDNVDAIGTESREMELAEEKKKEMEEYGQESELKPTLLQKSTNCNTNVNFEDGKGTKNERKDNKTTKKSDGDKSKENGEGFKPGNMTSIEAHVKEMPEFINTEINFDEAVKHDEILASSTDENTSTENGDKQRKTATKEDNLEETATGSKDDSCSKYKVMNQKQDEISDTPL